MHCTLFTAQFAYKCHRTTYKLLLPLGNCIGIVFELSNFEITLRACEKRRKFECATIPLTTNMTHGVQHNFPAYAIFVCPMCGWSIHTLHSNIVSWLQLHNATSRVDEFADCLRGLFAVSDKAIITHSDG